jgi:hypothetical protein
LREKKQKKKKKKKKEKENKRKELILKMYPDEANMQKQKKRDEQIRRWRESESAYDYSNTNNNNNNNKIDSCTNSGNSKGDLIESFENHKKMPFTRQTKVRFPKGCVFLAACSSGDIDEVNHHLKLGVNRNTTNIDGLTALHQACIDANIDMVKFLVENNADINAQDNEGWTPLHASVSVGNLEVSKYLINNNARLDICNNDSDLPYDLCDVTNLQIKQFLEAEMKHQSIDIEYEKKKEELIMYEDAKQQNFDDKIHQKTGATPLHVSAAKGYNRVMRYITTKYKNKKY